ncbi:uncharacterized protein LOC120092826 isoform X2 [Benincasa hispida]|nr:uncharacterized protein LOC120092826 isoform X2 [Benincasa hispida]
MKLWWLQHLTGKGNSNLRRSMHLPSLFNGTILVSISAALSEVAIEERIKKGQLKKTCCETTARQYCNATHRVLQRWDEALQRYSSQPRRHTSNSTDGSREMVRPVQVLEVRFSSFLASSTLFQALEVRFEQFRSGLGWFMNSRNY